MTHRPGGHTAGALGPRPCLPACGNASGHSRPHGAATVWHKSSHSGGSGGDCLEVAANLPGLAPVRDSKNPHGPKLAFRAEAWTAFVANLKHD
ncbi:DUF397 domain-containing protein [Streptomyces ureilyticus]|uniref:DUF397 domain-containing protein n=1 Tax=Streptomyces ureilyticus TaxID=1775131 RepID=A0ABX0E9S9_9ACTN|nr:DUF397 domain-containing protein [Streptomyces ureilyticus]